MATLGKALADMTDQKTRAIGPRLTPDHLTAVSRSGLADQLAERLLEEIVAGVYPPDSRLPPEPVLAERAGVSRLTLREAIKDLRQRGVLRVQQGRGTFVNPPTTWAPFDSTVLNARALLEPGYELAHELTELRRIVERGIAELAAVRRSNADLERMAAAVETMKEAWAGQDLDAFSSADVDFHDALLRAAGNTFALTLFHSVDGALRSVRRRTVEENSELAERAIEFHTKIMNAVRRRARRAAGALMDEHLQETEDFTAALAAAERADVNAVEVSRA
ncbi:FadR/GntR family transcriptional regulator [Actinopolymorpha alba]|uniref:FadR/GntR family transcriptional regulator n=1 Tax=Actinopolymorpha alba TaxID=533267 RepID=UPI00036174CF|nr:FadR/GntR family transcriptional regulator [Actinopolymorpha alba]